MPFFRVTWNDKYNFATLHNWGCTFHCPYCSYKLRSGADGKPGFSYPKPERFLSIDEIKEALLEKKPAKVNFMGGEPGIAENLEEILLFAKKELKAITNLGHTNGSTLPMENLDAANVGFKAWSEELHLKITGRPKELIYNNFENSVKKGLKMAANLVFIPDFVGLDELKGLVNFIKEIDKEIPFHIMGYIPVPGQNWRRPSNEEMQEALKLAKNYLQNVNSSHLTSEEALNLQSRDDRFKVEIIAGC